MQTFFRLPKVIDWDWLKQLRKEAGGCGGPSEKATSRSPRSATGE